MNTAQNIPLINIAFMLLPVLSVIIITIKWSLNFKNFTYALARMLAQLLLIGYCLAYLFNVENEWIIIVVLTIMIFVSSWIALGPMADKRIELYKLALIAVFVSGVFNLLIVTQGVLVIEPWYNPRFIIPLAGMIFSAAMNSVSLAVERLHSECGRGVKYKEARQKALQTAMIPVINSLFAVGLVSLPGMMTGQILSGVSPLIAVRYQIVVMLMIFGTSGLSAALFLQLLRKKLPQTS